MHSRLRRSGGLIVAALAVGGVAIYEGSGRARAVQSGAAAGAAQVEAGRPDPAPPDAPASSDPSGSESGGFGPPSQEAPPPATAPAKPEAGSGRFWTEKSPGAPPMAELPSLSGLATQITPTVVAIQVEQKVARRGGDMGRGGGVPFDPFDFFFPPGHPDTGPRERAKGLGSGFFISADGLILTNAHVVEDATDIEIIYDSGSGATRTLKGKVLGVAEPYDVALVRTEEKVDMPVAPLGNSDQVKVGDWVMAVGNPFGLSHSASVGIISAKQRRDLSPSGREGLYDFLQTDASINPGNSGGPLVNLRGEVIGINAAVNAVGQGIGFAIPINLVKSVLPQLKEKGKFSRSWIGVRIQPLTPELAQSYGLKEPKGALVADVVPNGPAAQSGLKEGDVIVQFDGKDVVRSNDLPLFASMAGVGKTVPVVVLHDGQRRTVHLKLGAYPKEQTAKRDDGGGNEKPQAGTAVARIGLSVADLSPELRQQLGLDIAKGVVVTDVADGSAADAAGLQPGDVVVRVGGEDVTTAAELAKRLQALKAGEVVRFQVQRGQGGRFFLALRMPSK
jgi:serine protease Do